MIKCIAIGKEEGMFFVQTCCGEEHIGQMCDCKSIGDHLTEDEAKIMAERKAKEFKVSVEFWNR